MLNYRIEFDSDIKWKSIYRRNNKGKDSKHILCFPDHYCEGHISNGFCGRSIKVKALGINGSKLLVLGNFNQFNEDLAFSINDTICLSVLINNNQLNDSPYYIGREIEQSNVYEINSNLRAWKMNNPLSKIPKEYSFCVYLFIESNKPDYYICVSSVKSPPFLIVSSRRNNINNKVNIKIPEASTITINQPPFSPVNNNNNNYISDRRDERNEKDALLESSSFSIKSKKDPNLFKFDYLMPHIYDKYDDDKDNSKSERNIPLFNININNNSNNNNNNSNDYVIDREVDTVKGMQETMKDVLLSKPNTIYKVHNKGGRLEVKVVNHTQVSEDREEFSFFGDNIKDIEDKHMKLEYLDRFGNKCVLAPEKYLKNDEDEEIL